MPQFILLIGLHPDVPSPRSPAEIREGQRAVLAALVERGYFAELCQLRPEDDARAVLHAALQNKRYDCICIGAGLRLLPEHTALLETVVNTVHFQAPRAALCFNLAPADTVSAVERCLAATSR